MANTKNITYDQLQTSLTRVKTELDKKAASSHGTHVSYGTSASAVSTSASAGSASTVSRSDHAHSLSKSTVTSALGYTPPTSDTWRPVQDNLTSTSTSDCLSANQGKVLKGLVDGKAASTHGHSLLGSEDTRSVNGAPNSYTNRGILAEFKSNSTIGLPNSGKNFAGTLTYQQWSDISNWSGGKTTQFATIDDGRMYFRKGENTSWEAWQQFYTTVNKPSLNVALTYDSQGHVTGSSHSGTEIINAINEGKTIFFDGCQVEIIQIDENTVASTVIVGHENGVIEMQLVGIFANKSTSSEFIKYYDKDHVDNNFLGKTAKAADSSKLNGVADSVTATANTIVKRDNAGCIVLPTGTVAVDYIAVADAADDGATKLTSTSQFKSSLGLNNIFYNTGGTISGDVTMQKSLTVTGNITGAKVYGAVYNDYAEWFEREDINEVIEAGDIVSWGENGVTKSTEYEDSLVVGVYSDSYGHILGGEELADMEENIKKYVPIGLCGRVYVKVTGEVKRGDLITASDIPGVGTKSINKTPGTIIGKALESYDGKDGIKKIKIMVFNN